MLKSNDRLQFDQDMAMKCVKEKSKLRCNLSYKCFKSEDVYDTFLDISPFPKLVMLKEFLDGIHHCVTDVGKCIFNINCTFAPPPTQYNQGYCCIIDNEKKLTNGYKVVLKSVMFTPIYNIQVKTEVHPLSWHNISRANYSCP